MFNQKFKNKYRIDSARLKNYDYASNGAYYITIMTKNREHIFGEILDNDNNKQIQLSDMGQIIQKYWNEIPQHFSFIKLDEMVIMPNHIHGILWIENDVMVDVFGGNANDGNVGNVNDGNVGNANDGRDATETTNTTETTETVKIPGGITKKNNPMFYQNLSRVIRWYKGRCTFEINKKFGKKLSVWQPRFHDRIIRDEYEMNRIRQYIINNPENWKQDRNNLGI